MPALPTSGEFDIPTTYKHSFDGKEWLFKDAEIRGKRALLFVNER